MSKKVKVVKSLEGKTDVFGERMEDEAVTWVGYVDIPEKAVDSPYDMAVTLIVHWKLHVQFGMCAVNAEPTDMDVVRMHLVLHSPTSSISYAEVDRLFPGICIEANNICEKLAHDYINRRGFFREADHMILLPALYDSELFHNWKYQSDDGKCYGSECSAHDSGDCVN